MTANEQRTGLTFTGEILATELRSLGFVQRAATSSHVLLALGNLQLAIPTGDRPIPESVLRMFDASVAPVFGHGRLLGERTRSEFTAEDPEVLMLEAIVLGSDLEGWRAFLADDNAIIGFGPTRDEALHDLKDAGALRMEISTDHLVLITPDIV